MCEVCRNVSMYTIQEVSEAKELLISMGMDPDEVDRVMPDLIKTATEAKVSLIDVVRIMGISKVEGNATW